MYRSRHFYSDLLTLGAIAFVIVFALVLTMAFLSAVARVLRRVPSEHRRMEPGQVWLNLIPVFNIVWVTVTVERVAESLRAEFAARGMHGPDETYGRRTGLRVLVLLAISGLFYPAIITLPLAFANALMYWSQMNRYAERLKPGAYAPPPTDEGW